MITVNNIHFSMGQLKLLDDVSFDFQPGELLAIIVSNVAVKFTLLRLLFLVFLASSVFIFFLYLPFFSYTLSFLSNFLSLFSLFFSFSLSFTFLFLFFL